MSINFRNNKAIEDVRKVAAALEDLNEKVVFTGGAVTGLYADDPGAGSIRPTKDVDVTVEISSISELNMFQKKLAEKGIFPANDEKVMCRFKCGEILLDVMGTERVSWAPSNSWFKPGFRESIELEIGSETRIRLFRVEYFLAAKLEAFHDRAFDARLSNDFEDIVYVLDNRLNIVKEIGSAAVEVKKYLCDELNAILEESDLQEAVLTHLEPVGNVERYEMIVTKLEKIIN